MKKCAQPGRTAVKEWARAKHALLVEVHELDGEPRRRYRRELLHFRSALTVLDLEAIRVASARYRAGRSRLDEFTLRAHSASFTLIPRVGLAARQIDRLPLGNGQPRQLRAESPFSRNGTRRFRSKRSRTLFAHLLGGESETSLGPVTVQQLFVSENQRCVPVAKVEFNNDDIAGIAAGKLLKRTEAVYGSVFCNAHRSTWCAVPH